MSPLTNLAYMAFAYSAMDHDALFAQVLDRDENVELPLGPDGQIALSGDTEDAFDAFLDEDLAAYVLFWTAANGEIGVMPSRDVLPGPERTVDLLEDATQALGKTRYSVAATQPDFAICSAHKLGGPKGVGAAYVAPAARIRNPIRGGGQEMGRRSGTENVIGIAGFGAAAEAAQRDLEAGVWDRVEKA